MIFNDLPTATDDDLLQLEEVVDEWSKANELLDDDSIKALNITTPLDFMRQFANFLQIPYTQYLLYINPKDKSNQIIYNYDGRVLAHNVEQVYGACDSTLVFKSKGKCGLIDYDHDDLVIPAEYDDIYDEGVGSNYTFTKNGVQGQVTFSGKFYSFEDIENLTDEEADELCGQWIWADDTV